MVSLLSFSRVVGGIQHVHSTEGYALLRCECCANAAPVTDWFVLALFFILLRSFTDGQAFLDSTPWRHRAPVAFFFAYFLLSFVLVLFVMFPR